ncbi:hypothetical protein D210916BOD24_11220 [Alteromonas sp. D210916BOD_24]|uniref:hypothetical protein n=1 Tax=Alteromonas sp. D210916BOD_24 TaxID=3157618 RepID=UPI00399D0B1F
MSDVYIGFMDEEVRPILKELFNKGWNVLVIEREDINPQGRLFESPISVYGMPVMWKGWVGIPDGSTELVTKHNTINNKTLNAKRQAWLDVFQQCVFMNFLKVYQKLPTRILEEEKGKRVKRKLGLLPSVSMLYMGKASGRDSGLPTKILIRSPEMGMQPGLIRTQLRGLLKSIKSASNATEDKLSTREANRINLWSYGAGGAFCNWPQGGPNKVWDIRGSLFVGVERDKSAEENRLTETKGAVSLYTGSINYCSDTTSQTLYKSPAYYFAEQARSDVDEVFETSSESDSLLKAEISKLKNYFGSYVQKPSNSTGISITSNSFIGESTKDAALKYDLVGEVNMEDYHLLKLVYSMKTSQTKFLCARSIEDKYPVIDESRIIRIDADPAKVSALSNDGDGKNFTNFGIANPDEIDVNALAHIICWGLKGMQFDSTPDDINWKSVAEFISDKELKVDNYLFPYSGDDVSPKKYINPFLLESAQDLFQEVGAWIKQVQINDQTPEEFDVSLNKNPFNISDLNGEESREQFAALVTSYMDLNRALISYCKDVKSTNLNDDVCLVFITSLYALLFKDFDGETPVNIWARGGWGAGVNEPFIVKNVKYSGSIVDRALYKSTNSTVLNLNAEKAVNEYFVK